MSDEDTTRQFSPEGGGQRQGRTVDDLFSLVQSLRGEFTEFRDRVELRLLSTTPLSETLEAVRVDVGTVAERQDTLRNEVAEIRNEVTELRGNVAELRGEVGEIAKAVSEIAKGSRRIESKVNGISIDFSEIKGTLQNHEVRLQALNSE